MTMTSMRYVRDGGGNSKGNTRGHGSSLTLNAGARNKWTHPGRPPSSVLAARGGRGQGSARPGGGGRGRFSGGRFSRSFVRGSATSAHGDRFCPVGKGNKWVRESGQGGVNAIAKTEADATASVKYDNDKTVDKPNHSMERRGKHKLVMKTISSNIASERAAAQTQVDRTHVASQAVKSGNNSWRRQSSDLPVEKKIIINSSDIAPERAAAQAEMDGTDDSRSQAVKSGSSSWKRRPSELFVEKKVINSSDIAPERVAAQTQLDGSTAAIQAVKPGTNSWKRLSSEISLEKKITNSLDIAPERVAAQTQINGTDARSQAVKSGSNSWKRQSSELLAEEKIINSSDNAAESGTDQTQIAQIDATSQTITPGNNSWKRRSSEISSEKKIRQNSAHAGIYRKGKRADPATGPRRISLLKPVTSEPDKDPPAEKDETVSAVSPSSEQKMPSSEKTLTDFCYQNTGRGRGQSSIHCIRANAGRSMGLVRVKPQNPSSTPVCPTFRRGLPCNNPRCTLRHDVASEALRPICVFFQRNGMCSKDDCPFRHVKVRWDVEICPVFERMGYCEDPNCLLRHIVAKKPRVKKQAAQCTPTS